MVVLKFQPAAFPPEEVEEAAGGVDGPGFIVGEQGGGHCALATTAQRKQSPVVSGQRLPIENGVGLARPGFLLVATSPQVGGGEQLAEVGIALCKLARVL